MAGEGGNWSNGLVVAGRYTIASLLGAGGMGEVYRAWDGNLGTDVVIKVPLPEVLRNPEFVDRFDREIRSLVRLAHPSVVRVTDCGNHQGLPFAVMAFLPGGSLKDKVTDPESQAIIQQPIDQLEGWLVPVASALDFIHAQGFIHRDVKPANILFDGHGYPYLSDFGIAKVHADNAGSTKAASLTAQNMVLGTPEYMAPELIMGHDADGRIDQYALAVTLYEVLCGQVPFQGPPTALLVMHTAQEPPPLVHFRSDIPEDLELAVLQAMAKSPNDRFPTCTAFAKAVAAAASGRPKPAPTIRVSPPAPPKTPAGGQPRQTLVAPAPPRAPAAPATKSWSEPAAATSVLEGLTSSGSVPVIDMAPSPPVKGRKKASSLTPQRMIWIGATLGTLAASAGLFAFGLNRRPAASSDELPPAELQSRAPMAKLEPGSEFKNHLGMTMVCIRPGRFVRKEKKLAEEAEKAIVTRPFWISAHETTVAQYFVFLESSKEKDSDVRRPFWLREFMKNKAYPQPYAEMGDPFRLNSAPVVGIRRADAEAFCQWLTETEGMRQNLVYRLPTRDEWLCAFRAGTETRFYWGDELTGGKLNGSDPNDGQKWLAPVGKYPANPWGLFDMAGNVREMVTSPDGVIGGGWSDKEGAAPSLTSEDAELPAPDVGFRIVAQPASSAK